MLPASLQAVEDSHDGQSLEQAANDPTASLMNVQLQNLYYGNYHNLDDQSGNTFQIRSAVPFKTGRFKHIARVTLPIITDSPSDAYGITALWAPDWQINDKWSYAMSATIPWVEMDVEANIITTLGGSTTLHRSDKESGFGDIILMPLMFNQKINKDLNVNYRLAVYAPTGGYEVGRLANTGKNFWTVEPTAAIMYFGQKNGIEASLFFGMDFNTENSDTNYKSGIQAHLDGTLAQHFPLWKGLAGAGVTGFWYQQISDDSGEGANFCAFRARAHGIGPVLSYSHKTMGKDVIAELKWLHEFDNVDRLEGDTIFFKILAKF